MRPPHYKQGLWSLAEFFDHTGTCKALHGWISSGVIGYTHICPAKVLVYQTSHSTPDTANAGSTECYFGPVEVSAEAREECRS